MHCQYLILLQFVMPKWKTIWRNPDSWQCSRPPCSGVCVTIFNKEQHHEWCGDVQKETTTQSGLQKTVEPWKTRFVDGHQKQGWVGAGDSSERRTADVAESFLNRRVQFHQLWTNAAQITADNNRDNEQVKLRSLQGQTKHMDRSIESVNFLQKSIVLVTHIALTNSKLCRIHKLFSSHRSTRACSGIYFAPYQPTQTGHRFVGRCNRYH